MRRSKARNPAQRMRFAVEAMPRRSREAMLRGMDDNTIIAGAYTDRDSGGICPMLAAHRNGGRTSLASFARSWDRFTGAHRPRVATEREVRALRTYLEMSLSDEDTDGRSMAELAAEIRAERSGAGRTADAVRKRIRIRDNRPTGERDRSDELRGKRFWSWIVPARRYDDYSERIAAASERLGEEQAAEVLAARQGSHGSHAGAVN